MELHPLVRRLAISMVKTCELRGIKIYIQTPKRHKTIHPSRDLHELGLAFDIGYYVRKPGDKLPVSEVAKIGMAMGLAWGGTSRNGTETSHFQKTFRPVKKGPHSLREHEWINVLSNEYMKGGKKAVWQMINDQVKGV